MTAPANPIRENLFLTRPVVGAAMFFLAFFGAKALLESAAARRMNHPLEPVSTVDLLLVAVVSIAWVLFMRRWSQRGSA